ncbi:hypothetical protein SSX86_016131 [Deinandra increscens subsp. villosa]|uniref:Uncharacterized protein n=1 Tax=Deinandra increscens subsp. villosa TaxID=3103831 RepID=A0AAP0D4Q1_9ASTR
MRRHRGEVYIFSICLVIESSKPIDDVTDDFNHVTGKGKAKLQGRLATITIPDSPEDAQVIKHVKKKKRKNDDMDKQPNDDSDDIPLQALVDRKKKRKNDDMDKQPNDDSDDIPLQALVDRKKKVSSSKNRGKKRKACVHKDVLVHLAPKISLHTMPGLKTRSSPAQFASQGRVKQKIAKKVYFDIDWSDINFCEYILQVLKDCKNGWKPSSNFNGPLTILTLLYVDSFVCEGMDIDEDKNAISFWNMDKLQVRQKMEARNGGFGRGEKKELSVVVDDGTSVLDESGLFVSLLDMLSEASKNIDYLLSAIESADTSIRNLIEEFPGAPEVILLQKKYDTIFEDKASTSAGLLKKTKKNQGGDAVQSDDSSSEDASDVSEDASDDEDKEELHDSGDDANHGEDHQSDDDTDSGNDGDEKEHSDHNENEGDEDTGEQEDNGSDGEESESQQSTKSGTEDSQSEEQSKSGEEESDDEEDNELDVEKKDEEVQSEEESKSGSGANDLSKEEANVSNHEDTQSEDHHRSANEDSHIHEPNQSQGHTSEFMPQTVDMQSDQSHVCHPVIDDIIQAGEESAVQPDSVVVHNETVENEKLEINTDEQCATTNDAEKFNDAEKSNVGGSNVHEGSPILFDTSAQAEPNVIISDVLKDINTTSEDIFIEPNLPSDMDGFSLGVSQIPLPVDSPVIDDNSTTASYSNAIIPIVDLGTPENKSSLPIDSSVGLTLQLPGCPNIKTSADIYPCVISAEPELDEQHTSSSHNLDKADHDPKGKRVRTQREIAFSSYLRNKRKSVNNTRKFLDASDLVFYSITGVKVSKSTMSTLNYISNVDSNVLKAFTDVMNWDEKKRSDSSPHRLFLPPHIIDQWTLYDVDTDEAARLDTFVKNVDRLVKMNNITL